VLKQVRKRIVGAVRRNQFVAIESRLPFAFGACSEDSRTRLIAEPIMLYQRSAVMQLLVASARVSQHVGPPLFARRLLWV
jgi:hypothetical protein